MLEAKARARNLQHQYDLFKENCMEVFLWALQEPYDPELLERLKDRDQFQRFFDEPVSPDQKRWHAVLNGLDEYKIKSLIVELEILMAEIRFTLSVIDIDNQDAFAFLKHLSQVIYRSKNWTPEYDGVKHLSDFMWSVHTGFSIIEGYTGRDIVAEMIEAI
jgi:hypothetical protein